MLWYRFTSALALRTRLTPHSSQVVLLTGCDSGLGLWLARAARERGLTVVAGLLQGPKGAGGRLLGARPDPGLHLLQLDVTQDDSVARAKDYVEQLLANNHGYVLHAVVNNAGIMVMGEFEWQPLTLAERQLQVNLLGAWRVTRALLPALRRTATTGRQPRVLAVGSHCAGQPLRALAPYSASKAALRAWAEGLRMELRPYGVSVVDFVPGRMIASTNILSQQDKYTAEMRSSMTEEQLDFYGDYFDRFTKYVNQVGENPKDPEFSEDPVLIEAFFSALLDKDPLTQYKHEPLRYTFYYNLFKIAPFPLRHWLMEKFLMMPQYEAPAKQIY